VNPGLANKCDVIVEDIALEMDAENGWTLTGPSEIEILGDTCEAILDGTYSQIEVSCPCGVIVV
jgi:hypothetical protein